MGVWYLMGRASDVVRSVGMLVYMDTILSDAKI
jgi:hypothetical protein